MRILMGRLANCELAPVGRAPRREKTTRKAPFTPQNCNPKVFFYSRVLGFDLADEIEPAPTSNQEKIGK
jgi:hypothetical protein